MDTFVDSSHSGTVTNPTSTAWLIGKSAAKAPYFSGWRRVAIGLTCLITLLAALIIAALAISLNALDNGRGLISGQSLLFQGNCEKVSQANLWIHLGINVVASGVLASSNFFMQALIAPTRKDVDKAHAAGNWVEIGVQSIWNMRFVSRRNVIFWVLFALSSVPLHLLFNGAVLESRASTGFQLVIASESFLDGAPYMFPEVSNRYQQDPVYVSETVGKVWKSVSSSETRNNWEKITFQECMNRYNEPKTALMHYRHVVMVISDKDGNSTKGWSRKQVIKDLEHGNFSDTESVNSLWWEHTYDRTEMGIESWESSSISRPMSYLGSSIASFGSSSGILSMSSAIIRPAYLTMRAQYCMSEKFNDRCQLTVANPILLTVCAMCILKCILCILYLTWGSWGADYPLLTPGDAIESFITRPDEETKGMCTLDFRDLVSNNKTSNAQLAATGSRPKWLDVPRKWQKRSRRAGQAVPRRIWYLSYSLIGSSLLLGAVMFVLSIRGQSIGASKFSHNSANSRVEAPGLQGTSLVGLTMIANIPQLILSICYMAYNGLFTRMLGEFEWASYSLKHQTLRVTHPKGQQRPAYRLQLPYRFSIPLLIVSILLHWIYSNCIYVSNYEGYDAKWPYNKKVTLGLQHSTVAVLIALLVSIFVAMAPLFLSYFNLPGDMPIAGSRSAVIAAACHCSGASIGDNPSTYSKFKGLNANDAKDSKAQAVPLIDDLEVDLLQAMVRGRLKWGEVLGLGSGGKVSTRSGVGHLSFGTIEQDITRPCFHTISPHPDFL